MTASKKAQPATMDKSRPTIAPNGVESAAGAVDLASAAADVMPEPFLEVHARVPGDLRTAALTSGVLGPSRECADHGTDDDSGYCFVQLLASGQGLEFGRRKPASVPAGQWLQVGPVRHAQDPNATPVPYADEHGQRDVTFDQSDAIVSGVAGFLWHDARTNSVLVLNQSRHADLHLESDPCAESDEPVVGRTTLHAIPDDLRGKLRHSVGAVRARHTLLSISNGGLLEPVWIQLHQALFDDDDPFAHATTETVRPRTYKSDGTRTAPNLGPATIAKVQQEASEATVRARKWSRHHPDYPAIKKKAKDKVDEASEASELRDIAKRVLLCHRFNIDLLERLFALEQSQARIAEYFDRVGKGPAPDALCEDLVDEIRATGTTTGKVHILVPVCLGLGRTVSRDPNAGSRDDKKLWAALHADDPRVKTKKRKGGSSKLPDDFIDQVMKAVPDVNRQVLLAYLQLEPLSRDARQELGIHR